MINRSVLECVEALMRPMKARDTDASFGEALFIGTGDFRQVAPVIKGGSKMEIVDASVKHSWLWRYFETVTLKQPMRFSGDATFSTWLDAVGDDDVPLVEGVDEVERRISLARFHKLSSVSAAIESMFSTDVIEQPDLCVRHAILSPINSVVDKYNEAVLKRIRGDEGKYVLS
jgi:ATP-dependent DNA helicase PIF1